MLPLPLAGRQVLGDYSVESQFAEYPGSKKIYLYKMVNWQTLWVVILFTKRVFHPPEYSIINPFKVEIVLLKRPV